MQWLHLKYRNWATFLGLVFLLGGTVPLLADDSHDTQWEDPFDDAPRFVGSDLHNQATGLVTLLKERERLIREGIQSGQLEYDGQNLQTKPGASEEIVEGLSSLNNRIELLARAKTLLNSIQKYSANHPEDRAELEQLKTSLGKAVEEYQKLEEHKSRIENTELKQLSSKIRKALLELSHHKFNLSDVLFSDSKQVEDFIKQLKKYQEELQDKSKLSSSDDKLKQELLAAVNSGIENLETYRRIHIKNEQLDRTVAPAVAKKLVEDVTPGLKQFGDQLAKWTGDSSWKSSIQGGLKKLEQLAADYESKGLHLKNTENKIQAKSEESKTPSKIEPKETKENPLSIASIENAPKEANVLKPQALDEIKNLEDKLADSKQLQKDIETELNSKKELGINLELEYRNSLKKIAQYQNTLQEAIAKAEQRSPATAYDDFSQRVFSKELLNPEPPKSINNDVISDSISNSVPPKTEDVASNSQTPRGTTDNSPKANSNSGNTNSVKKALPESNNSSPRLSSAEGTTSDTNLPKTRVSSFDDTHNSEHNGLANGSKALDSNTLAKNTENNRSSTSAESSEEEKALKSPNKSKRNIASSFKSNQQSESNSNNTIDTENANGFGANQNLGFTGNLFENTPKASKQTKSPLNIGPQSFFGSNDKSDNNKTNPTDGNNSGDTDKKTVTNDNASDDSEPGFSLRKQPRRSAKNAGTQQKRRMNNETITSSYVPNTTTYLNTSYSSDTKSGTKKVEATYVQNPDKTFSKESKNESGSFGTANNKSAFDNLNQISSEIKAGTMDSELDLQVPMVADKSIWEKIGLSSSLDSLDKILSELYPAGVSQKPSELTKLLMKEKLKGQLGLKAKNDEFSRLPSSIQANLTSEVKNSKPNTSLMSALLAWLGFN